MNTVCLNIRSSLQFFLSAILLSLLFLADKERYDYVMPEGVVSRVYNSSCGKEDAAGVSMIWYIVDTTNTTGNSAGGLQMVICTYNKHRSFIVGALVFVLAGLSSLYFAYKEIRREKEQHANVKISQQNSSGQMKVGGKQV